MKLCFTESEYSFLSIFIYLGFDFINALTKKITDKVLAKMNNLISYIKQPDIVNKMYSSLFVNLDIIILKDEYKYTLKAAIFLYVILIIILLSIIIIIELWL